MALQTHTRRSDSSGSVTAAAATAAATAVLVGQERRLGTAAFLLAALRCRLLDWILL
jgi:hypothetical protein